MCNGRGQRASILSICGWQYTIHDDPCDRAEHGAMICVTGHENINKTRPDARNLFMSPSIRGVPTPPPPLSPPTDQCRPCAYSAPCLPFFSLSLPSPPTMPLKLSDGISSPACTNRHTTLISQTPPPTKTLLFRTTQSRLAMRHTKPLLPIPNLNQKITPSPLVSLIPFVGILSCSHPAVRHHGQGPEPLQHRVPLRRPPLHRW